MDDVGDVAGKHVVDVVGLDDEGDESGNKDWSLGLGDNVWWC